ncbi:MAG: aminotransferase class I/II-fold pyridoxal phosphate-dependent enzyme [Chlorobi bacterium]|nr:aminotransferase class I/II-fold pyridoxal phosphate-dependent enzyme [Chlorobiota bacterium]
MAFNTKYPNLTHNYFIKIRKEIEEHNAINLSEGFTGFHCSDRLVNLVQKHLSKGLNQYGNPFGEKVLRDKIAEKVQKLYGNSYDADKEVTITAGETQAVYTAISAIIKEGDEVIVFEPSCINIVPAIKMNGGQPVYIPTDKTDFKIDWVQVQKMITAQTRMIIIHTPHSPSGSVLNELDMLRLQKIINGTNIIILSIETFEHIVFDGELHQSMALYPILANKSIIISSFGETYHVTGWQTGYCIAPEEITDEIRKVQETSIGSVNTPFQLAFADFLQYEEEYLSLSSFYQKKRDKLNELLESSNFIPLISKGSYFEVLDFSKVSNKNDVDFVAGLIREHGIALAPMSIFSHTKINKKLVRINFAQPDEILEKVSEKLLSVSK